MTPDATGPTDREIGRRGAFIAASLGMAWLLTAGGAKSTFDYLLQCLLYGSPFYIFVAVVIAVLVLALRGRQP